MKTKNPLRNLLFTLLCAAATGQAQVIVNADFNAFYNPFNAFAANTVTYTGTGAVGTGTFWNSYLINGADGTFSASNLTASDGLTSTAVDFTVTFNPAYNEQAGSQGASGVSALNGEYLISPSGQSRTLTLSGLTANGTYDLYLYSEASVYASNTNFTIGGNTLNATNGGGFQSFTSGGNYVVFSGVTASGAGEIVVSYAGGSGEGVINGFQLVNPIPEPTTGLLVVASVGVFALARRRRSGGVV